MVEEGRGSEDALGVLQILRTEPHRVLGGAISGEAVTGERPGAVLYLLGQEKGRAQRPWGGLGRISGCDGGLSMGGGLSSILKG